MFVGEKPQAVGFNIRGRCKTIDQLQKSICCGVAVSQTAVMEEVFLWLQRTMLGMVDDEEETFVELGRKLLTVHKYVVANATTEADLSRAFWAEASALTKHVVDAVENIKDGSVVVGGASEGGIGGGGDPREDSVLLALPGFRFKVRCRQFVFSIQDQARIALLYYRKLV